MFCQLVFCCLCFGNLVVFGNSDAVKVVQVTEGDTVTLQTNVTQLLEKDLISWTFGDPKSCIAEINKEAGNFSIYDHVPDGRFRKRLKLDHQTGSLNITNSKTTDSGLYEMTIKSKKDNTYRFSVTVYAHLPVPVISSESSQCSSLSICSLDCSSEIVGHGSLSWYKKNLLWSSISVSDLSINLSLPLVVQYQDKTPYSCVLKNPISNQTTHLNFTQLCGTCAVTSSGGHAHYCDFIEAVLQLVVTVLMGVAAVNAIVGQ
ncbi:SLAM family member 5-like [Labeo rohita]|uniref:SLAM family member 5-like n=1 Tax=Labeo rohita TaxID=84645 RepID=UPI0021E309CF|nr:SLAM family member 5-like [Labeo rohita]